MHRPYQSIRGRKGSVAALDIGTCKVACLIAEEDDEENLRIIGIGHQLARGLKNGRVISARDLEESILSAVHAAEQMAGATIENVVVNVSGPDVASQLLGIDLEIAGEGVSEQDINDLMREGCASVQDANRALVHCFPVEYRLDGARGIRDALNMYGNTLGADLNIITADVSRLRNLAHCVNRCHLNIAEFVASQHAAAYGCLDADEMELGTTLIDMGGSETSFALFSQGRNIFSGSIPIGGQHVTSDIAQGLTTSLASAERLKNLHGSAIAAPKDTQVMIEIPQIGEEQEGDEPNTVPRSTLIAVIRPRLEEIFEMIRDRIQASGMEGRAGRHAVLTGGASQMVGVRDLAARVLGKQVRIAKPRLLPGLADSVSGAPFSCAIGMLHFVNTRLPEDILAESRRRSSGIGTRTQKMFAWLRDNF